VLAMLFWFHGLVLWFTRLRTQSFKWWWAGCIAALVCWVDCLGCYGFSRTESKRESLRFFPSVVSCSSRPKGGDKVAAASRAMEKVKGKMLLGSSYSGFGGSRGSGHGL
jgi:hypothetical protein